MRLKRKYHRIEFLWEDHHSDKEDSWTEPTKADELEPGLILTSGYLVSESRDIIEVARDMGYSSDDSEIGAPIRILKKCIRFRQGA